MFVLMIIFSVFLLKICLRRRCIWLMFVDVQSYLAVQNDGVYVNILVYLSEMWGYINQKIV